MYNVLWFIPYLSIHLILGVSCFYNWHTFYSHCIRSEGPYFINNRNYVTSCTTLKNSDRISRAHFKLLYGKKKLFCDDYWMRLTHLKYDHQLSWSCYETSILKRRELWLIVNMNIDWYISYRNRLKSLYNMHIYIFKNNALCYKWLT